jgi:hypothetical protein
MDIEYCRVRAKIYSDQNIASLKYRRFCISFFSVFVFSFISFSPQFPCLTFLVAALNANSERTRRHDEILILVARGRPHVGALRARAREEQISRRLVRCFLPGGSPRDVLTSMSGERHTTAALRLRLDRLVLHAVRMDMVVDHALGHCHRGAVEVPHRRPRPTGRARHRTWALGAG